MAATSLCRMKWNVPAVPKWAICWVGLWCSCYIMWGWPGLPCSAGLVQLLPSQPCSGLAWVYTLHSLVYIRYSLLRLIDFFYCALGDIFMCPWEGLWPLKLRRWEGTFLEMTKQHGLILKWQSDMDNKWLMTKAISYLWQSDMDP